MYCSETGGEPANDIDFNRLFDAAGRRDLAAGEHLFRRGETVRALFAVTGGRLRLARDGADGRPLTLLVARPGELLTDAALFAERYHCDAVAELASQVAVYPKNRVAARLRADPELAWRFQELQARRIQQLRVRLELGKVRPAAERVWRYLQLLAVDGTLAPERPLKDLAGDIGLSHEAFYRALAALQKAGRIDRAAGQIRVCDGGATDYDRDHTGQFPTGR